VIQSYGTVVLSSEAFFALMKEDPDLTAKIHLALEINSVAAAVQQHKRRRKSDS